MEFYLNCECGHRISVTASQAGSQIVCDCGREIDIPRLGELRKLAGLIPISIDSDSVAALQQAVQANNPYASPGSPLAERRNVSDSSLLKLFWIDGRARRAEFWCLLLLGYVLYFPLIVAARGGKVPAALLLLFFCIISWIITAVRIRRWHDRDKSGLWWFIRFVPFIGGLWEFIEQGFMEGTIGENDYGPDPVRRANELDRQ